MEAGKGCDRFGITGLAMPKAVTVLIFLSQEADVALSIC